MRASSAIGAQGCEQKACVVRTCDPVAGAADTALCGVSRRIQPGASGFAKQPAWIVRNTNPERKHNMKREVCKFFSGHLPRWLMPTPRMLSRQIGASSMNLSSSADVGASDTCGPKPPFTRRSAWPSGTSGGSPNHKSNRRIRLRRRQTSKASTLRAQVISRSWWAAKSYRKPWRQRRYCSTSCMTAQVPFLQAGFGTVSLSPAQWGVAMRKLEIRAMHRRILTGDVPAVA